MHTAWWMFFCQLQKHDRNINVILGQEKILFTVQTYANLLYAIFVAQCFACSFACGLEIEMEIFICLALGFSSFQSRKGSTWFPSFPQTETAKFTKSGIENIFPSLRSTSTGKNRVAAPHNMLRTYQRAWRSLKTRLSIRSEKARSCRKRSKIEENKWLHGKMMLTWNFGKKMNVQLVGYPTKWYIANKMRAPDQTAGSLLFNGWHDAQKSSISAGDKWNKIKGKASVILRSSLSSTITAPQMHLFDWEKCKKCKKCRHLLGYFRAHGAIPRVRKTKRCPPDCIFLATSNGLGGVESSPIQGSWQRLQGYRWKRKDACY